MNLSAAKSSYDLLIIGAGPAGLSCAIEAQKMELNYLLVDKGSIVDSIQRFQRNMFFFSTPELLSIGDIPFVVSTTRPTSLDCVNYYRSVAEYYRLQCRFFTRIESAIRRDNEFIVQCSAGDTLKTHSIVVATGYYDTPNPLNVPGEDLPHVSHYYRDPFPYFQQDVLIVGGKNSVVEAALDLYRHGARVMVVHRGLSLSHGVKYWILPDFENRVADGSINLLLDTVVKEFRAGSTLLQKLSGDLLEYKTDHAFVLIGYRPNVSFLRKLGIEVDPDSLAPCHDPETMQTNVKNIFVAGGLVAGRFNNKVFIENGRNHGKITLAALSRS